LGSSGCLQGVYHKKIPDNSCEKQPLLPKKEEYSSLFMSVVEKPYKQGLTILENPVIDKYVDYIEERQEKEEKFFNKLPEDKKTEFKLAQRERDIEENKERSLAAFEISKKKISNRLLKTSTCNY